jgi:hypothetical protein
MSTRQKGTGSKASKVTTELRKRRDLWKALNDAIKEQDEDAQNDIAEVYRLHRLYAKHFPEDHALAREYYGDLYSGQPS